MADLGNYSDKLKPDDQNQDNSAQAEAPGSIANGTSGVVTGGSGSQVSTAGIGAGGIGGWTNIQAYLEANKGDNGSSQNLNDKAGGLFDSENQNLQTQANATKSQALGEANKVNDAKNNSKQWINQAANAYDWSGNQTSDYTDNTDKLKHAMSDPYAGPNSFSYGKSADFQNAQSALGDDSAFSQYMNKIYQDKAGGQLNQGQGALQTQLDVNNQNLADTRKNLLDKYAGFDSSANDVIAGTDSEIQKARNQYGNNQSALKSTIQNYGNDYQTAEQQAEADARGGYNKDYTTGKSNLDSVLNYGSFINPGSSGTFYEQPVIDAQNNGIWGDNLTWNQLQKEKDYYAPSIAQSRGASNARPESIDRYDRNSASLGDFYNQQDQKYANTADSEKRNWNTIMDILGNADRAKQGFAVRG